MRIKLVIVAAISLAFFIPLQTYGAFIPVSLSSAANVNAAATITPGGATMPTGNQIYNGIPFSIPSGAGGTNDYWGAIYAPGGSTSATITLSLNVNIPNAGYVYTLMNTFWGAPGPDDAITFTDAAGDTYTKYLTGDVDIRDFNNFTDTNTNATKLSHKPAPLRALRTLAPTVAFCENDVVQRHPFQQEATDGCIRSCSESSSQWHG